MDTIGQRIKKYRKEQGLTQGALARMINKNPNLFSRYERGEVKMNAETLSKIASALGIPTSKLLEVSETSEENQEIFIKTSEYKDKTNISGESPSMAYWGTLIDNAQKISNDNPNLDVIYFIVDKARKIIKEKCMARKED